MKGYSNKMNAINFKKEHIPTVRKFTRLLKGPTGRQIVHEAGHAMMCLKYAENPVCLLPKSRRHPDRPETFNLNLDKYFFNRFRYGKLYEDMLKELREPLCLLAGPVAEMLFYGDHKIGKYNDISLAQDLLSDVNQGATMDDINDHIEEIRSELYTKQGKVLLSSLVIALAQAYNQYRVVPKVIIKGLECLN